MIIYIKTFYITVITCHRSMETTSTMVLLCAVVIVFLYRTQYYTFLYSACCTVVAYCSQLAIRTGTFKLSRLPVRYSYTKCKE